MKRPQRQTLTQEQKVQQAKESEFRLGVQCGAYVAKHLIESGWTDMEKFEAEVLSRLRGKSTHLKLTPSTLFHPSRTLRIGRSAPNQEMMKRARARPTSISRSHFRFILAVQGQADQSNVSRIVCPRPAHPHPAATAGARSLRRCWAPPSAALRFPGPVEANRTDWLELRITSCPWFGRRTTKGCLGKTQPNRPARSLKDDG